MKIIKATPKDLTYIVHLSRQEFDAIGFIPLSRYEKICKGESGADTLDICYEMDDLAAEAYFSENPHVNRDVDVVTLPPMSCDRCEQLHYEMILYAGMNDDDCF